MNLHQIRQMTEHESSLLPTEPNIGIELARVNETGGKI